MLTLLLALSAQAAEFPVANAYEVSYEELQAVPADMKKHEVPKLAKANIAPPTQLGWDDMPDGLGDLANGLAWWLKAPAPSAVAQADQPAKAEPTELMSDDFRNINWSDVRALTDVGGVRQLTARDHTISYGRVTVETDTTWSLTYNDAGLATQIWGDGRMRGFGGSQEVRTRMDLTWAPDRTVASIIETSCYGPTRYEPGWRCNRSTSTAVPGPVM